MSLSDFFESNYQAACEMQHSITKDYEMKIMVKSQSIKEDLVMSWMRDYGLFQGIKSDDRNAIVRKYYSLVFNDDIAGVQDPSPREIESMFSLFLLEFYNTVPRKWLSATSKLLWCSFPNKIVIYDSFVERALVILQGVTSYLADMPRIKTSTTIKSHEDIDSVVTFYMNYQNMVIAILAEHQDQFNNLRKEHSETYPHDIRIVDKLLWMLGNPNQSFTLNGTTCNA